MIRPSMHPCFETLENRRLMSVAVGLDGVGRLHSVTAADFGQTADLTLTVQPGNKLTVAEGGTVYGTFPVAKSLAISLGANTAGFVNRLDLNNLTLAANVHVQLGDMPGLNQFGLTTGLGGTGTLNGNYAVQGGNTGGEFVVFGDFGQAALRTINVTGSVQIDMGGGGDTNVGPPDAVATVGTGANSTILNVGRNFNVTGSTVLALRGSVGGNLISDSSAKPAGQLVILGNFSQPFQVARNVVLKTGAASDDVELQAILVNGNADIRTGDGDDVLLLTSDVDLTSTLPTRIQGNVFADLGKGNDTVEVSALSAPRANMQVLLGDGDDEFRFADHATVNLASLLVDGGGGTGDVFTLGAGNSFSFATELLNFP